MFSRDSKRKLALTPDLPFSVISVFSVSQDFNTGNWDTKRLVIAFLLRNSQARPNFPRHLRALKKTMMVLMTTVSRPERTILAWKLRSSMLVSVTMGRKQMFLTEYQERMEGVTLCQCPCQPARYCPRSKFVSLEFSDDPSSDRILVSILLPVELALVFYVRIHICKSLRKFQYNSEQEKN